MFPGTPFALQGCARLAQNGADALWRHMGGKPFYIENKFDGWRVALHSVDPDHSKTVR